MPCVLCGAAQGAVCLPCEQTLAIGSRRVRRVDLEGASCADYSGPVATLISGYKTQGYLTLARGMAKAMANTFGEFRFEPNWVDLVIVPVPDHPDSIRPFSPTSLLARELSSQLGLSWLSGLTMVSAVADQASLSVEARRQNLVNAMKAKPWMSGRRVLLLDDLVTTGSTLLEARRALVAVDCEVVGFLTFAETLKKTALQK